VSDEPQALERSTLQKKDRAELMTIATAMGGKPGSRAKKADVIDMILELAGVASDDAGSGAADAREPTSGPSGKAKDASADGSDAADAADEPDADAESAPASGRGRGQRARDGGPGQGGRGRPQQAGKDQAGKGHDDKDQAGKGPDDTDQDGTSQSGNERDGGRGQGGQDQGDSDHGPKDQGGQGGRDDDGHEAEPGNRRRRRRGRDRGGQGQGQDEPFQGEPVEVEGFLDLRDEGYGFLRVNGYLPTPDDVYVSVKQSRQFALRKGDRIKGASRPATRNEKNPALMRIDSVNGRDPEDARDRPTWEDLTPLFPDERLRLEADGDPYNMTARIVDLLAPIGKGQRGLIVSPPKAGKTSVVKQIVRSIETNNPEVELIVLLVDERPEEVTDMQRWMKKGEVASSTFDRPPEEHTQVAELVLERAKRQAELGTHVVLILDGITRLARAYNLSAPQSGRVMSGGVDAAALYPPKRFFGAARNIEEGGSLTILATALVETGSRMDEVIFEEFKGTGNMELRLDRRLADRRIYPAIDVEGSGTRHEELLFTPKALQQVWKLRRVLSGMADESGSNAGGIELLTDRMRSFKTNDAFLDEIAKGGN
jgi:transcription termination factor Rho